MRFGRLVKDNWSSCSPPARPGVLASLNEKETDTPSGGLAPRISPKLSECSKTMRS